MTILNVNYKKDTKYTRRNNTAPVSTSANAKIKGSGIEVIAMNN